MERILLVSATEKSRTMLSQFLTYRLSLHLLPPVRRPGACWWTARLI